MKKIQVMMTIVVDDEHAEAATDAIEQECEYCLTDDFGHLGLEYVRSHLNSREPEVTVLPVTDEELGEHDERRDFYDSMNGS